MTPFILSKAASNEFHKVITNPSHRLENLFGQTFEREYAPTGPQSTKFRNVRRKLFYHTSVMYLLYQDMTPARQCPLSRAYSYNGNIITTTA